jgi:LacI family repressor for deo operon, udp, cdd, tsx, nupC, and nupG
MKNDPKTTIKEIADMAGVSVATVSRVMNHKTTVREDTQRKILEVMAKVNFHPSSVLLTDNTSRTILLCVGSLMNPFYNAVINGIQKAANQNDYRIFIMQAKALNFTFEDFKDVLQNHAFVGIIIASGVASMDLLELLAKSCPVIMCFEKCDVDGISFVCIDDVLAARKATNYLSSIGCTKIALLNGSLQFQVARNRELGYMEAIEKANLEKNEDWVIHVPSTNCKVAYSYALDLLSLPNRPDAVFATSDVYAMAVIQAARQMNLRVPADIAVIGFDNIDLSSMFNPTITTIEQPAEQMGFQAYELLIEKILNPLAKKKRIILDTELIVRESTSGDAEKRRV